MKTLISAFAIVFAFTLHGQINIDSLKESLESNKSYNKKEIASIQFKIGQQLNREGKFEEALEYLNRSLQIRQNLGDKQNEAATLNNIGFVYEDSGNYDKAMEYYNLNLSVRKEIKDSVGMAWALNNIALIYKLQSDIPNALIFHNKSLNIREKTNDERGLAASLNNIGNILKNQGNYLAAIDHYTRSLKISEKIGDKINLANVLNNIGEIHFSEGNNSKAIEYFVQSLSLYQELGNKKMIAFSFSNLGLAYEKNKAYSRAIQTLEKSLKIREEISDAGGIAISLLNIGYVHLSLQNYEKAKEFLFRSLQLNESLGNKTEQTIALTHLSSIYIAQNEYSKAIALSKKALDLAKEVVDILLYRDAAKNLYKSYRKKGQYKIALEYKELYTDLQDSIKRDENQRALLNYEFQLDYEKQTLADSLEFAKKEAVKDLEIVKQQASLDKQRTALFASGGGIVLILLLAYSIFKGKKRSDELLLNILPKEVAKELKQKGFAEAKEYTQSTILFTDFKGFTSISEQMSAEELVKEIDTCFKAFDRIMEKNKIEKIKTIGDAYMAAGGLQSPRISEPKDVVKAALELQKYVIARKKDRDIEGLPAFEMRVGIHTGPVVAGVVGIKKFQYDIWGDSVNLASRMESNGEAEKVNISTSTYQLVRDTPEFTFEARGKIEAKGKGQIDMYFVNSK